MSTRFEFDFHTKATPDQVIELFTDFSAERPKRWPALSAKTYEVYRVGETDADVQEGQDFPKLYSRWRYDWSEPGTVTLTVTESKYVEVGSYHSITATAAAGGGSDIHGEWESTPASRTARIGTFVLRHVGPRFFGNYYRRVFDKLTT